MACETICTFFNVFLRFFSKSKKHDFLRFFELLHTFSPTVDFGGDPDHVTGTDYSYYCGIGQFYDFCSYYRYSTKILGTPLVNTALPDPCMCML